MQAWHTDIVVRGQGFGLKLRRKRGWWTLTVDPDTRGSASKRAWRRFFAHLAAWNWKRLVDAKRGIEHAIARTNGRWNGWHRHAY